MIRPALAFLWGLAEATLWFVVPDVLLSGFALSRRPPKLFHCVIAAVAGALAGGALMWIWGRRDPSGVVQMLERIPAIRGELIERVRVALSDHGLM